MNLKLNFANMSASVKESVTDWRWWSSIAQIVLGCILVAVAFVVTKTKLVEKLSPIIAWAGIILAIGVVAFFMIFPTGVFFAKVIELVKGYIPKIF